MKVWIIIGHLIIGPGAGGDVPMHHGTVAFASVESCESWRRKIEWPTPTECKELTIVRKVADR